MRYGEITKQKLEYIRNLYPVGARVELISMDDPYTTLAPGCKGTVNHVDDMATIHVSWDNGSGLGVVYGVDAIRRIKD